MDELLGVEVQHATGHLPGPAHHLRGQDLRLSLNVVIEGALGTELHDDTVARRLGAHAPGSGVCVCVCVCASEMSNLVRTQDHSVPPL